MSDFLLDKEEIESYYEDGLYSIPKTEYKSWSYEIYGEAIAKAQDALTKKGLVEDERRKMLTELDNIFILAPNDDSYLRILIKDLYEAIKAGKWARAELGQALQKEVEDG